MRLGYGELMILGALCMVTLVAVVGVLVVRALRRR